ncbi:hypothetical protein [uncultured Algoriphagus sp.]|uniref:hypothetical protein n=1 Tax=uncultured Algoriphagus sp. TaxID=417365 RepID=UPI0030EE7876
MRIGKNSHRYDTTSLELEDLRFGKVFQKIDHIVFLILGISALLEDDVESAKNFLYNIPTQDWCDETCFVLGNCHYLSGQFAKGLGLWQKAISKNSNHLRAKINVARHQLSVMLREGGSLNEEVAQHIKESLSHYDPKSISIDELALMGVLYADLGEKEMAIEAFKAALKAIKKPQGAFYYYMKLGLLKEGTSAAEEYVNAALAAEKPEFQELCIRLIVDCDFPNDEKRKNLAKIRENSRINGRMGKLNIESLLAKSKSKTSNFNDFLVFEISGRLRKNGYKHVLKNGEMLNYDDWVVAENNPVKAVLIKCNNEGMTSPVKRLFLNSNSVKKVEETLYEYADPIKSSGTDEEMLLLHMRKLEHFKISKQEKVRAVCKEIGLNLNLTFDEVGKLILDRRMFTPYSQQITGKFILLEIQKDFKSGVFETIRELKILIPDNHEVEKRIRAFSEFIDFSDNKYYLKLAGYLSDFYATADQTDIKLWSVSRYLKLME